MKLDLHIYSIYSLNLLFKPESTLKIAKKRRLGEIAVTDTIHLKGALKILNQDVLNNN